MNQGVRFAKQIEGRGVLIMCTGSGLELPASGMGDGGARPKPRALPFGANTSLKVSEVYQHCTSLDWPATVTHAQQNKYSPSKYLRLGYILKSRALINANGTRIIMTPPTGKLHLSSVP